MFRKNEKKTKQKKQATSKAKKSKSNVWKIVKADFQKSLNNCVTFSEFVGVKRAAAGAVSPQECFQLLMTKDILEQIIQEKHCYHMQEHTKKHPQ